MHYKKNEIKINIKKYGHLYGPLKVPDENHPTSVYIRKIVNPAFLRNKKISILLRDPRDLIVSMYYSFGFTHNLSPNPEIRAFQEKRRENIQSMTIDQYAIAISDNLKSKFDLLETIIRNNKKCIVLKYEDLIENYDEFIVNFKKNIPISGEMIKQIYKDTRPREKEDVKSHKRYGISGGYRTKLSLATIEFLNNKFSENLKYFGYRSTDD
jgi:hypothetical protein